MSHLSQESAENLVKYNLENLENITDSRENLRYYFRSFDLENLLYAIFQYLKDKKIIIYRHQYVFFAENNKLTYTIRRKNWSESSTCRKMNLLCALGFFRKIPQTKRNTESLLEINSNFLENFPDSTRPINVYAIPKYSPKFLEKIEERAERLTSAGVTASNMSYVMLVTHGLEDIAREVFPQNSKTAPDKKIYELSALTTVIDMLIESQGYATRTQIADNLLINESEMNLLYRYFKNDLRALYRFTRPTDEEQKLYNLNTKKYIYTRKKE